MMDYLQVKGRIFDIQKFSVHDGPGIRTIVFFKGCSLRCRWCCNPESQSFDMESMTMGGKRQRIGRDVTVAEVLETVLQDQPYYRRSRGGLTLSGGEAFIQPEFAKALLHGAKENGIHTAVETAASVPFENIQRALPELDLILMDIKHMDPVKHKEYIGRDNRLILENAGRIAAEVKEMIIRVPVVPGFNDTQEEIGAIARFAASLPGVERIHLLPYHRLGQDKYAGLNRAYTLAHLLPPPDERMRQLLQIALDAGLKAQIGG